jgi:hypothetical protein
VRLFNWVLILIFVVFFVAIVVLSFVGRSVGATMGGGCVCANPAATIIDIAARAPVPSASIMLMSFIIRQKMKALIALKSTNYER